MLQVRASLHCITCILSIHAMYHVLIFILNYSILFVVTLTSSADSVCPGDTVVFTCVTDTGRLLWVVNNSVNLMHSFHSVNQIKMLVTEQFFKLELVNVTGIDQKTYLSTATAHNVLPDYNGTTITCMDSVQTNTTMTLYVLIGEKLIHTFAHASHNYDHVQHHLHLHPSTSPPPHSEVPSAG